MPFNNEVSLVYSENRSKTHLEAIACPRKASEVGMCAVLLRIWPQQYGRRPYEKSCPRYSTADAKSVPCPYRCPYTDSFMTRVNNCHQNVSVVCNIDIIFTDLNDIERSPTIPSTTVLQRYGYGRILAHPKCSWYGPVSVATIVRLETGPVEKPESGPRKGAE